MNYKCRFVVGKIKVMILYYILKPGISTYEIMLSLNLLFSNTVHMYIFNV